MNIGTLKEINSWWTTGSVSDSFIEAVPRKMTPEIETSLDERQIVLLEGPRMVGKSSILFHLIMGLLKKGVDPRHVIYASLDDPLISKERFFERLIEIIETHLIGKEIQSASKTIYLFLDEITHLQDWELYLKRYYDLRYPIKFVISSSAASFLVKKGKESLAGRLFRYRITPFSFSEFLHLRSSLPEITALQKEVGTIWDDFFETQDSRKLIHGLERFAKKSAFYEKQTDALIREYLLNGGFPEFLRLKGERAIRQYFPENVIERAVYHDIPEAFKAADRGLLQNLLLYSIFHSGSIININEIAASFNASRQTVSDYLHYLQASMLVCIIEKYAKTEASRLRAFRKVYTVDPGLYVHLQRLTAEQVEQRGLQGSLAEIAVFTQLNTARSAWGKLFYFREREHEVNFVIETLKGLIPVEVKYRETPKDIKGIRVFSERFKPAASLVITRNALKMDDKVLFVPLRMFLS